MTNPIARRLNITQTRVEDLERRTDQQADSHRFEVCATDNGAGVPAAGSTTNPWRPRHDCNLTEVIVELDAVATADVTVDVLRDGVSIGACTVATGSDEGTLLLDDTGFTRTTQLVFQLTDAGTGWTRITVHGLFHTARPWLLSSTLIFGGAPVVDAITLNESDESGPKGHVDVPITVPDSTTTITVTFTVDPANPGFVLDFLQVVFDPTGAGTPLHNEFPGTAGPTDCAITGSFAAGPATLRVFAQSSGASPGDLVDYSIAFS